MTRPRRKTADHQSTTRQAGNPDGEDIYATAEELGLFDSTETDALISPDKSDKSEHEARVARLTARIKAKDIAAGRADEDGYWVLAEGDAGPSASPRRS